MGSSKLEEQCLEASKMRDEYEREGGFSSKVWADDAIRYRNELSNPVRRSVIFAMQALYQLETNFRSLVAEGVCTPQIRGLILSDILYYESDSAVKELTTRIFDGVCRLQQEIDEVLQRHITCNWNVSRLAYVERSLLRIGIFSLLFDEKETRRDKHIINCCSELSGEYSNQCSTNFVYGVLREVSKEKVRDSEATNKEGQAEKVEPNAE
ncbi:MAG: transcription antitermination protein NusB [Candidatus Bruticola sp.]